MEIAKALILAAPGTADHPWATASGGPKQLFPVGNRPLLFHNLEALSAAGMLEVAILTGDEPGRAIRRAVGDGSRWGMRVAYADWAEPVGIAGALQAGREFLGDEPVFVQRSGALLRERMHEHISAFAREELDALALRLLGPQRTGQRASGYLLSARGVSMLLDGPGGHANPVVGVRAQGGRVRVQRVDGCLACDGDVDDLLESNRQVLDGMRSSMDPGLLRDCTVQGAVEIHPSARVERSLLRGPIVIGPGACVIDAYIGPYTSIGAGAVVEGSEIEHSIVLRDAEIRFLGTRLESSVIGRGARVVRRFDMPSALRIAIGEGAEVQLQ